MAGAPSGHDAPSRRRSGWLAVAGGLAVVALVAGTLLVGQLAPTPTPSAGASTGASAPPSSGPTASAAAEPEAWAAADLPPFELTATLEADDKDAAGVATGSAFTLTSTATATARDLAARLAFVPPVEFAIAAGPTPASARLIPRAPLEAGTLYRAELTTSDGAVAGVWTFRARTPIHAVETIPGDRTTDVPISAGVEVTFDQDGTESMEPFFSISPRVDGRFERSGRTQVFVPNALAPATLYAVTVRSGLGRSGSDVKLERDVTFKFETATGHASGERAWRAQADRPVLEASPDERPVIGVTIEDLGGGDQGPTQLPKTLQVSVYRYPSREAAVAALVTYLAHPTWAAASAVRFETGGLTRVVWTTQPVGSLNNDGGGGGQTIVRLPARLPRGWYLVDIGPDHDAQTVLQVTEVSAWVSVLTDRTVVWANDTLTGRPLPGATVSTLGGPRVGTTDAAGLMVAKTPDALVPPSTQADPRKATGASPLMVVTARSGRSVLVPFEISAGTEIYRGEWWKEEPLADESWWSLLATDRTLYRTTDHVNVWGLLRRRADRSIPGTVSLRIVRAEGEAPPVVATTVNPGGTGAFAATLELSAVAGGTHYLEALVDGHVVARRWLDVGTILKPLYRLTVSTDRHVVASGESVTATTAATFFDDQPVPGLALVANCHGEAAGGCPYVVTDAGGEITGTWKPALDSTEDASSATYDVRPPAEEANISAAADVLVFPSSYTFDSTATLTDRRVVVKGTLREVDFARIERELVAGTYEGLAGGNPVPGRSLTVRVIELVPVTRLVRRAYDYIEKRVVPVYEYSTRRRLVGERPLVSRADGTFTVRVGVPHPGHQYQIVLTTTDPRGRTQQRTLYAGERDTAADFPEGPRFDPVSDHGYSVGDRVRLSIVNGRKAAPSGGSNRYLYLVAQRGLRDAYVSSSPHFTRTFKEADIPRVFVVGVRFTGSTYAPKAATWLDFDTRDRALTVKLETDEKAYRPGDTVTLTTRVTDKGGKPVAAAVVLRAIDEKLFAMGGAAIERPLDSLYGGVTSGILRFTATHQVPVPNPGEGEGGDATGGGVRDDFRDSVLFRLVQTDSTGVGRVTFDLSDDLTSWHISATALTGGLEAGEGQALVPVSLPFFVETVIAESYVAGDRPVLAVRAFGAALQAGDPVGITVSAPSLGIIGLKLTGDAFTPIAVPLPALTAGTHEITIEGRATARTDAAGAPFGDAIRRSIRVDGSRLQGQRSSLADLTAGTGLPGGDGLTRYTFTDTGRGRFVALLQELASSEPTRADQAVAQRAARALLIDTFGWKAADLPPAADITRYPATVPTPGPDDNGDPNPPASTTAGLALLPWSGPSPVLAARAALAAPDAFQTEDLAAALESTRTSPDATRELRILATAGLAALGRSVADDMAALKATNDLAPREQLYASLAAEAYGDQAWALALERDLLRAHGESSGPWTRLKIGTTADEISLDTALLSVVAAGIGDPVADALFAYVDANPPKTDLVVLERVGYIRRMLPHTPAAAAGFAWTVDGERHVVDLGPGESATLVLTAAQRSAVGLEPLSGQLSVSASWLAPLTVAGVAPSADVALTRSVTPAGGIKPGTIVDVTLSPKLHSTLKECWEVSDYVPSGLVPVAWGDPGAGVELGPNEFTPDLIDGQRVVFGQCSPVSDGIRLRYRARTVTSGDYAWEPALVQRASDLEIVAIVPATRATITGP
jgi:hypothetical protein